MGELEVAAKIAELNRQLALKDHEKFGAQAELNQKIALKDQEAAQAQNSHHVEMAELKKQIALKDQQSLDYHNALRKLGESAQYSEGRVLQLNKDLDRAKQQVGHTCIICCSSYD